jgi:hypothetical protein
MLTVHVTARHPAWTYANQEATLKRRQIKPKVRKTIEIPYKLRSYLQDVEDLLEEKERNPDDVNIDFDDAIQCGGLCGGRDNRGWLNFAYHFGNEKRCTWHFRVHEFEIQSYARGMTRELTLYMCDSTRCQCGSEKADFICAHCDFTDDGLGAT